MEFKFRAVDDRPSPFPSPTLRFDRSDQPLPIPDQSIAPFPNFSPLPLTNFPSGFPRSNLGPNSGLVRNPIGMQGFVMREFEKERISEEVIMEEIARRRDLEAMVRGEIMFLEREMAMRRAAMGAMPFENGFPSAMRFTPYECSPRPAAFNPFPVGPPPPEDHSRVIKAPSEPNKDKLIVLAKPDPHRSQAKRKALGPPDDANEVHPFGLKKKPKEEFSCAICQVGATCDKDLNNHLQGRKHKRKEAALKKQKVGKNPKRAPCRKKTGNPSEPKETNNNANSNPEEGKSLKHNEPQNGSDKKKEDAEDLKPKNKLLMQKDQKAEELNKTSGLELVHKADSPAEMKAVKKTGKMFKFWCEMCHVGSLSPIVMEQHKKGKKHQARLLGFEPKKRARATLHVTQTSVAVHVKTEDPNAMNQANGKTADNISNTEIIHVKPEDTGVANQANGMPTDNNATTEAVHVKTEGPEAMNQANGKTADNMANTEVVHVKLEDLNVENHANGKPTDDMATTEAVHVKTEDPHAVNQANGKTADNMANTEVVHVKPEDTDVTNQANGKPTDDMATTEAVHAKTEDPDAVNQANGKTADNMANTEFVHGKPEDTDVANQANGKPTDDMATTDTVQKKPEDTGVANQANGKTTDDMDAAHENPEDADVANQPNEKTIGTWKVQISRVQLQRLLMLSSVAGQN